MAEFASQTAGATHEQVTVKLADLENSVITEDFGGKKGAGAGGEDLGACGYNRPPRARTKDVGQSQSCMLSNRRLIPHAYRADVVPDTLDWTAPELMAEDGHSHVSQASDVPSSPP